MKDHRLIDERSLAFDRLTAAKLAANPALANRARANAERWLKTCSPRLRPVFQEWLVVLDGPRHALLAMLTATDERATRLRQSSPFAGALSVAERTAVLQEYQRRESSSA